MKYAITPDKRIHQVTDEQEFYKHNPKAQDVTELPNIYQAYCDQEAPTRICEECSAPYKIPGPGPLRATKTHCPECTERQSQ